MDFLYPFVNFLQPGILWPDLADYRPAITMAVIAVLVGLRRASLYPRGEAFGSKVFVYLMWFVVAQGLSVYYSGMSAMLEEFNFWFQFPLFVGVSLILITDEASLRRYVWGTLVGSMVVVFYGIYAVPAWGGYEGTGRAGAYGMYENHNDYSFIIIQILPFVYMYWRTEERKLLRLLLLISGFACLVGIAMSLSRGGMIALVLEVAMIVIFCMTHPKRLWLLPLVAVLGMGAIAYQYAKRAENQGSGYTAEDAENSRYELWKAGWNMIKDRPLLGVGSRRFPEYSREYYDLSHDQIGKVSHNTYIEVASGSGILGFLGFFLAGLNLRRLLRETPDVEVPPFVDATRRGATVAFHAIMLRAFLDAKPHDWCFYSIAAIGVASVLLQRQYAAMAEEEEDSEDTDEEPGEAQPPHMNAVSWSGHGV